MLVLLSPLFFVLRWKPLADRIFFCTTTIYNQFPTEYDSMDLEMLREVVPMLRQQLEKSMLDRNYVQLERVSKLLNSFIVEGDIVVYKFAYTLLV